MIRHVLTVGDSFTYGEELSDRNNAWPYLVAASLNATIDNQGAPATGNTSIVRNTLDNIVSTTPADLVIISWSSPGRIEFSDDEGTFDTWPGYMGRQFIGRQPWREDLVDYVSRYHNDKYLYKQYLTNIVLLQSLLTLHNIKYIMLDIASNNYYENTCTHDFLDLKKLIDRTTYLPQGMAEWTFGCKKGQCGHFLDDGHRIVADRVLAKIKEMDW